MLLLWGILPLYRTWTSEEDSALDSRQYGLERIIITLPFNWGSAVPDRITWEDGTEVAVPCDALDGDNYGCGRENSDRNMNRRREDSERRKVKDKLETLLPKSFLWKKKNHNFTRFGDHNNFPPYKENNTQRKRTIRTTTKKMRSPRIATQIMRTPMKTTTNSKTSWGWSCAKLKFSSV